MRWGCRCRVSVLYFIMGGGKKLLEGYLPAKVLPKCHQNLSKCEISGHSSLKAQCLVLSVLSFKNCQGCDNEEEAHDFSLEH